MNEERIVNGIAFQISEEIDTDPDLSWLGTYTEQPDGKFIVIDRKARGDMGHNEYRYFESAVIDAEERTWYTEHGYCKHEAAMAGKAHALQAYERFEDLNRGGWYMLGLIVTAHVENCPHCGQEIKGNSSLWGIESDGDDEYREEIIAGLIEDVRVQLGLVWS